MTMLTWKLRAMLMAVAVTATAGTPTFTLTNNCGTDIWPGVLPTLENGGFLLPAGSSVTLTPPAGWSGRIWARTGCGFDGSGAGKCDTGDCGGKLACNGAGGNPPVSLAEFTLAGGQAQDFYDVSLVDGYNVAVTVSPVGGSGQNCKPAGCNSDLLSSPGLCPAELQVKNSQGKVVACQSACEAFGSPEYCCTGAYSTPDKCRPSTYSEGFKRACPTAYSYAYDDATSTFTCTGASSYTISFCH